MYREYTVVTTDVKSKMSTKSLPKKGGRGLEFQGLAAPPVFMCLPNVYQGNFLGVIPEIFPLIFPFL